jgi:hypothetical protein
VLNEILHVLADSWSEWMASPGVTSAHLLLREAVLQAGIPIVLGAALLASGVRRLQKR